MAVRDCPCGSSLRYAACCGPLHRGESKAATPEALMRSRYSAFVLGEGRYLVETLAASHPDTTHPPDLLARELGRVKDRQRFLGLRIVWAEGAEVLFHARIFEKGRDQSFAELSRFERDAEDGSWRYASGVLVPGAALACSAAELTRERFLAAAADLGDAPAG